jgi:DNA-binding CsgD family transcriptional regulator
MGTVPISWQMGTVPITLPAMGRTVLVYGVLLAAGAIGLQWIQYQMLVRTHPAEIYLALIAVTFMALGGWVAVKLWRHPAPTPLEQDPEAPLRLGISGRELEVLEHLAAGRSNKEIAQRLEVSPNTVKTHVAKLFEKLGARRRTQAILRARELGVLR